MTVTQDADIGQPVAAMQKRIEDAVTPAKTSRPASRIGKRALTCWVDRGASRQLA